MELLNVRLCVAVGTSGGSLRWSTKINVEMKYSIIAMTSWLNILAIPSLFNMVYSFSLCRYIIWFLSTTDMCMIMYLDECLDHDHRTFLFRVCQPLLPHELFCLVRPL